MTFKDKFWAIFTTLHTRRNRLHRAFALYALSPCRLSYLREEENLGTLDEIQSFGSFACFSAHTREGKQIKVEVSFVTPNSASSKCIL